MNKQGECDLQKADQAHDEERRETELSNLVSGRTGGQKMGRDKMG